MTTQLPYKNVGIYARVSMDEEDHSKKQFQDPENQVQPILSLCNAMCWNVSPKHIYIDKMSGANPARPEFRKMMADAMQRKITGIVVWKLDRFSREGVIPTLSYIKQLKDRGCWLKSMTESWLDTSNEGITEVILAIMSWVASEERKRISERTKAGIARKRALGKWRGGRPKKKGGAVSSTQKEVDKKGSFNLT